MSGLGVGWLRDGWSMVALNLHTLCMYFKNTCIVYVYILIRWINVEVNTFWVEYMVEVEVIGNANW